MKVSILPERQKEARNVVLSKAHEIGVPKHSEKAGDIVSAVGEAIANCNKHGGCSEAEINVAKSGNELAVIIEAPCYRDPETVKQWFERNCDDVDPSEEGGRGCGISHAVTKDIQCSPGMVCLVFDLPVANCALATI